MNMLIAGMAIFYGMHLVPSLPLKIQLQNTLGKLPYMGLFSLVSALGLGLMIVGKGAAEFIPLWEPMSGAHWVPRVLMLPALILICWAYLPCSMKTRLGHPMLQGIALFSIAHLFANGDLASVLLIGSFGLYSILTIIRLNRNSDSKTSKVVDKTPAWNALGIVMGIMAYALAAVYHQQITGMPIPH